MLLENATWRCAVLGESAATVDRREAGAEKRLSVLELESPKKRRKRSRCAPIELKVWDRRLLSRHLRKGACAQRRHSVVGDVNAGAVIVARGDVIVWGRLRGTVHAGSGGDESAVVCALNLTPTQLRIASYITISPEEGRQKPRPEKALVRNGRIEAEAWEA